MSDSIIRPEQETCRDYIGWINFSHILPFINTLSPKFNNVSFIFEEGKEGLGHFEDIVTKKKIDTGEICDMVGDELFMIVHKLPWRKFNRCMNFMAEYVENKEEEFG